MKIVIAIVVILALAGGGATWWYRAEKAKADDALVPPPTDAKVVRQDLRLTVDATGAVASNQDMDIKCQASGNIVELPFRDVNAHVPPGALLMNLDATLEQRALDTSKTVVTGDESRIREAQNNVDIAKLAFDSTKKDADGKLSAAKAVLNDAQNKAKRTQELFDQKLDSQEDLETANTAVQSAAGTLQSAQAAIDALAQTRDMIAAKEEEVVQMQQQLAQDIIKVQTAQQQVDYCTVTAPETDEQHALDLVNAAVIDDQSKIDDAQKSRASMQSNYDAAKQKNEAGLASAKLALVVAQNNAKYIEGRFNQKLASQQDLDAANGAVATANGALKSAAQSVDELAQSNAAIAGADQQITQLKQQLAKDQSRVKPAKEATLDPKDPPDWYVSAMGKNLAVGYLVQSGSSGTSGGTTVMTLSDLSHIFVLATVDESDFGLVEQEFNSGQELPVTLTADSFRNVHFAGKVVRIATDGVSLNNVVTFEVKIEVTSPNRNLLRPIMTTNVEILIGERKNCLTIPVNAVVQAHSDADAMIAQYGKLDGGSASSDSSDTSADSATTSAPATKPAKKYGYALNATMPNIGPRPAVVEVEKPDGTTEKRKIVIGLHDDSDTVYEVVSGDLAEGDMVKLQKFDADSRWKGEGNKPKTGQHSKSQ